MSFNAYDKKVYDLLNDKEYIIPPNQRKYIWNKNNWMELLDDILLVFDEKRPNHFIGSIVLKKETINDGIRNHFSIIDGQQRISTITILLCAIGYLFVEAERKDYFDSLTKPLFVNDNKNLPHPIMSKDANKVISNLVEELFYCANQHFQTNMPLVSANEFSSLKIADKNIRECFSFFYQELNKRFNGNEEQLVRFREIIDDIRYIDIVAEEDEDAYTIFEILNARGQVLTDYELLSNYLLSHAEKGKKNDTKAKIEELSTLLGSSIEMFLKHYIMHKLGQKTDKSEHRPYKVLTKYAKGKDSDEILEDLLLKAGYYSKMINYKNCSNLEQKIFSFFKPRRQQQFRPVVLGLMHQKDLGNISIEQYEEYLEFLYEFFICYHVIGEQTSNKIEDIVYAYSNKIENNYSESVLIDFRKSMVKRIPSEKAFIGAIKGIRYSHKWKAYGDNRKRENVIAIFEVIERELGYTGTFENCTIEHCLPDADSEENSVIGNLMLLEKNLNEIVGSKPIDEKCKEYCNSSFEIPRIVAAKMLTEKDFSVEVRSNWIAETLYKYITKIKEPVLV